MSSLLEPLRYGEVDQLSCSLQDARAVLHLCTPVDGHANARRALAQGPEARSNERAPGCGSASGLHRLSHSLGIASLALGGTGVRPVRRLTGSGHSLIPLARNSQDGQKERVGQTSADGDRIVPPAAVGEDTVKIAQVGGGAVGGELGGGLKLLADLLSTVRGDGIVRQHRLRD